MEPAPPRPPPSSLIATNKERTRHGLEWPGVADECKEVSMVELIIANPTILSEIFQYRAAVYVGT